MTDFSAVYTRVKVVLAGGWYMAHCRWLFVQDRSRIPRPKLIYGIASRRCWHSLKNALPLHESCSRQLQPVECLGPVHVKKRCECLRGDLLGGRYVVAAVVRDVEVFKRCLAHMEEGKYAESAMELLDSNYARQLPARSQRNADLIREG